MEKPTFLDLACWQKIKHFFEERNKQLNDGFAKFRHFSMGWSIFMTILWFTLILWGLKVGVGSIFGKSSFTFSMVTTPTYYLILLKLLHPKGNIICDILWKFHQDILNSFSVVFFVRLDIFKIIVICGKIPKTANKSIWNTTNLFFTSYKAWKILCPILSLS